MPLHAEGLFSLEFVKDVGTHVEIHLFSAHALKVSPETQAGPANQAVDAAVLDLHIVRSLVVRPSNAGVLKLSLRLRIPLVGARKLPAGFNAGRSRPHAEPGVERIAVAVHALHVGVVPCQTPDPVNVPTAVAEPGGVETQAITIHFGLPVKRFGVVRIRMEVVERNAMNCSCTIMMRTAIPADLHHRILVLKSRAISAPMMQTHPGTVLFA